MRPPRARPTTKYRNRPTTTADGLRFDSRAEARHWHALRLLERAGEITDLHRQVRLPLDVNGVTIGHYVADFTYRLKNGPIVIADVKGARTPLYRWKAKHVLAQYATPVTEVQA